MSYLDLEQLRAALAVRDLTDPAAGPHAMQAIVDALTRSIDAAEVRVVRASPVVTARDNYDRLYYPADGVSRDARHTRWIGPGVLLRSQTSAAIPPALDALAADPSWRDVALAAPGLVYRRDCIDRHHVGEPHQIDLWRISRARPLTDDDLRAMIARVCAAVLPGWPWRTTPAAHPYTEHGLQIDARDPAGRDWLEIGECGLASPRVLADAGLAGATGLAMGLGLDRLLMLRKGIPDLRLLRARDPRVAEQMLDLAPYRAVSSTPPVRRDLSIAVDADDTAEDLGDRVRAAVARRARAPRPRARAGEPARARRAARSRSHAHRRRGERAARPHLRGAPPRRGTSLGRTCAARVADQMILGGPGGQFESADFR